MKTKTCVRFGKCLLEELCDGKGIIKSAKSESLCLDYQIEGQTVFREYLKKNRYKYKNGR